jgi:hypothetical protein
LDYKARLRDPYQFAYPNQPGHPHPAVFMVPGNHDWYDGLVSFLALFCRKKRTTVGNWRTRQRRSYFAVQIKPDWWIWAIDIALTEDMDQPQADYFVAIARAMPQGAKIILCSAEPGWYEGAASFDSLHYAAQLANNAQADDKTPKNFRIIAALSGDTHHYARYSSEFGTEFVTSGGGGAFLHGTHSLKDTLRVKWLKTANQTLSLQACYPSREESRKLLSGNFRFPLLNWEFALLLGVIYWPLVYWIAMRPRLDTVLMIAAVLAAGFCGYGLHQAKKKPAKAFGLALAQACAHLIAIWLLSRLFISINADLLAPRESSWRWFFVLGLETVPIGGLLAGFIFGVNLWITSRYLDMNHNDAFSSMRLDGYRQFLRLRLRDNELTIYPVGLDRVPRRDEWRPGPGPAPVGSRYLPPDEVKPRLIEPPVTIKAREVESVTEAVKPHVLQQGATPTAPAPSTDGSSSPPSRPT